MGNRKRFSLQRTTWAHGISNLDVPERAWYGIATYASLKKARLELRIAQLKARRGTGWTHHVRLIAMEDIQLTATFECDGYHHHSCPHNATAQVDLVWPAGQTEPDAPEPEGWSSLRCPDCHQRQLDIEHEWVQRDRSQGLDGGAL